MGKGVGIFAPKKLSDALAAICGGKTMPRTEVTKKIWVYIKKNSLNQGRTIKPDAKLKAIFPVASIDMLKMAGYVSKTCLETLREPRPLSRRVPTSRRAIESRPPESRSSIPRVATTFLTLTSYHLSVRLHVHSG